MRTLNETLWMIAIVAFVLMVLTQKPWSDLAMIVALAAGGISIGMTLCRKRSSSDSPSELGRKS